ncbi:pentapeptide repeat family protein (plasmid) [Acaryochloris marina MBIC11017]|uniref:Pentapeptide repeat family protein n=2 Tax=Acaryochloris marina TaxID=155978 RepID=A8ZM76_ACAM1|nr:pentapeptide repeat family protein [Acaryochloris marina MBIC11017]
MQRITGVCSGCSWFTLGVVVMTAEELLERYASEERDFAGVDLLGANLAEAQLTEVCLNQADLTDTNLVDVCLIDARN